MKASLQHESKAIAKCVQTLVVRHKQTPLRSMPHALWRRHRSSPTLREDATPTQLNWIAPAMLQKAHHLHLTSPVFGISVPCFMGQERRSAKLSTVLAFQSLFTKSPPEPQVVLKAASQACPEMRNVHSLEQSCSDLQA
jgi:hypothetical protein